ncbi:hypothetical protein HanIR_Chr08g0350051 [Helianthus annuus]|nr:hypothetical protein HanIR_Chr08g0350051 [Helianthus annuus]
MLSSLRADGKEGKQVEALTQVIRLVLVGLLNHESNPDIMLLAARALTLLYGVLLSLCVAVVHYGVKVEEKRF